MLLIFVRIRYHTSMRNIFENTPGLIKADFDAVKADFDRVAATMCEATRQIAFEIGGEALLRDIDRQGITNDTLPKVEILIQLDELSPGAVERIMARLEQLQAERHARELAERESLKGKIALWAKAGGKAVDLMSRGFSLGILGKRR